jgi:hypothetical protein
MKRDMEVIRKVLLAIEEQYVDVAIYNLKVDDLDMKIIAYHCKLLYDAEYISDYKAQFAENEIYAFGVGSLTWEGHEFLDQIRNDTIWDKTKETITKNGLPMVIDVVKDVATSVISEMTSAAIKGMTGL